MRVISVAARKIPEGFCGGGRGVSYRLMKANEKYRMFEETLFIFTDKCISSSLGEYDVPTSGPVNQIAQIKELFSHLDEIYGFDESDFFVFHDLESFYAMKEYIPRLTRSLVVYHQQGSMYSESLFFGHEPNEVYEKFCFDITKFAVEKSLLFGFPSRGAKQALLDTLPEIGPYLENKREVILYNGCSPAVTSGNSAVESLRGVLSQVRGEIFITVAALNEAKGVERLPAFFREYGQYVEDYFWIVVGKGAKRDELAKGLEDLSGHVLWLENQVDNEDIIRLYDMSDYYILSHRLSIFDYSTIEAMHMGCVPVLTRVGGNLEMITEENGYFLRDDLSAKDFIQWRKEQDIGQLKEKNRRIARERFSEQSMLKAYYDIINETKTEG